MQLQTAISNHDVNQIVVCGAVCASITATREKGSYRAVFFVGWHDDAGEMQRVRVRVRGELAHICRKNLVPGAQVMVCGELSYEGGYSTVWAKVVNHLEGNQPVKKKGKIYLLERGSAEYVIIGHAERTLLAKHGQQAMKVCVHLPRAGGGERKRQFLVQVQADVNPGYTVVLRGDHKPGFDFQELTSPLLLHPTSCQISSPIRQSEGNGGFWPIDMPEMQRTNSFDVPR